MQSQRVADGSELNRKSIERKGSFADGGLEAASETGDEIVWGALQMLICALVLVTMLAGSSSWAADPGKEPAGPDPLFASNDLLEITLSGPFQSIARDNDDKQQQRPGTLTFSDATGEHTVPVRLRARGKSRRVRDVCSFPPIRLNLAKKDVKDTLFEKQDKLKLVAYCKTSASYEQLVLKEYLAYRILNLLTDTSFRVRLMRVNYVDTDRKDKVTTKPSFVIEHEDRVARRLGLEPLSVAKVAPSAHEPAAAALAELYQYLISNTDFSFLAGPVGEACCHNSVLFSNAAGEVIPIPYDFDVSGLVDAPYAVPPDGLGQRNVRDRKYRGFCRGTEYLDAAVETIQSKRQAIYALVDEVEGFSDRTRRDLSRFIDEFYGDLDDSESFEENIAVACRSLR